MRCRMRGLDTAALIYGHVDYYCAVGYVFEHAARNQSRRGSAGYQHRADNQVSLGDCVVNHVGARRQGGNL